MLSSSNALIFSITQFCVCHQHAISRVNCSCSRQYSTFASITGLSHRQRAISLAPLLAFDFRSSRMRHACSYFCCSVSSPRSRLSMCRSHHTAKRASHQRANATESFGCSHVPPPLSFRALLVFTYLDCEGCKISSCELHPSHDIKEEVHG